MDAVEVQDFLLAATEENESIFMDTDKIFDKNNDSTQSMYFSINDDTLSNKIVDDLQRMERTLTDLVEEDGEHTTTQEMSSVINTKEEESFLQMPLKTFPNHPMQSQCSTPKLEQTAPQKTPGTAALGLDLKLDASLAIPELVLPLTTVLQKMEKKKAVTIVENKENIAEKPSEEAVKTNKGAVPKKVTLRKSLIPNAPKGSTKGTQPSTLNARRSVRMSVVPTTFKSSRFTLGGASRIGKLNSPSAVKKSPKMKTLTTTAKSSRVTMTSSSAAAAAPKPPTGPIEKKPVEEEKKINQRLSRIPPSTATQPRPVFSCTTCKKTFHLKSTLLTHQKMHLTSGGGASGANGPSAGHFKCSFCDKEFEKEVGLRNHIERYCEKVPVAEKRKLNGSHNRTRTTSAEQPGATARDRSKRDKSSSSRLESTTSSVGSESSMVKKEQSQQAAVTAPPPASGLSPRKPIKSILVPHSGIKFSANKPIKCYQCKISFHKYVDFHAHVEEAHPQPVGSPVTLLEEQKE